MSEGEHPPPSYELSQQELDAKVDAALLASELEASSSAASNDDSEAWETWDDNAFETAAAAAGLASGSATGPTAQAEKALLRAIASGWGSGTLEKAPIAEESTSQSQASSAVRSNATPSSSTPSSSTLPSPDAAQTTFHTHEIPPDDDDMDHSIPPPPFTPVGPSLDGPPFESTQSMNTAPIMQSSPSRPVSEIVDPSLLQTNQATETSHRPINRRSLPEPPQIPSSRPQSLYYESPSTSSRVSPTSSSHNARPRVGFDNSMAYKSPLNSYHVGTQRGQAANYDAASLYNAAVSAQMRSQQPGKAAQYNSPPIYRSNYCAPREERQPPYAARMMPGPPGPPTHVPTTQGMRPTSLISGLSNVNPYQSPNPASYDPPRSL